MNKSEIQFTIDQLRKDKIIYAVESIATSLIGILYFETIPILPTLLQSPVVKSLVVIFCVTYWIYMGFGNFKRLSKIRKLEKQLESQS